MHSLKECKFLDVGLIDYPEALSLQKKIVEDIILRRASDTLISCQHPHVVTLSRRTHKGSILVPEEEFKKCGVAICSADRGGDATYHGPGQIVLYPIFDLRTDERDLSVYLRRLEEVIISTLRRNFGLNAHRKKGLTGVWVGPYKVASIGIGVRHWVTYHGVALNVCTDKRFFSMIKPCGLDVEMASINDFFDDDISPETVKGLLIKDFCDIFGLRFKESKMEAKRKND